jgi:hypothetical protein
VSHRRYKIGKFPAYDSMFDHAKGTSPVLNRGKAGTSTATLDLWSETGTRKLLAEYGGNTTDGFFDDGRKVVNSRLKSAREDLVTVDDRFENMKTKAIRAGRYPIEKMPEAMVQEKLVLEAKIDIILEEIDWLTRELSKYEARRQKQDDHLILASGPRGTTMGSDPPRSVDGQKVRWDEALGHFLIDCPQSPFHGMRLPDYYVYICNPWRTAKRAMINELQAIVDNLELSQAKRQRAGEEAARIRRAPDVPPWPPKPEGLKGD